MLVASHGAPELQVPAELPRNPSYVAPAFAPAIRVPSLVPAPCAEQQQMPLQILPASPTWVTEVRALPASPVPVPKQQEIQNRVATVPGVEHLEPDEVYRLLRNGECLLVDVRGEDRSAGLIEGAVHEPAWADLPFTVRAPLLAQRWADQKLVVFTCQYSAHRAPTCANWYKPHAGPGQRVAILAGGFRGWQAMPLPVMAPAEREEESRKADAYALEVGMDFAAAAGAAPLPEATVCAPSQTAPSLSPQVYLGEKGLQAQDATAATGIFSPVKLPQWMQALSPT